MLTKRTKPAVSFLNGIVSALLSQKLLTAKQFAVVHMVQDLLNYLDMRCDDANLLLSINAFRTYAQVVIDGDENNAVPFVLYEPTEEPETCFNCGTVLSGEYCPRCNAVHRWEAEVDHLNRRINRLEDEKQRLEYDLSDAERKVTQLERDNQSLDYQLRDAQSRASSYGWR